MADQDYILSSGLAVSLFLALRKQRPLFLEGEAGVGKTEVAKTLAALLDRRLIRLQCYEGLDIAAAAYEWNYARQMMQIQSAGQGRLSSTDLFTSDNLIERPLLEALRSDGRGAPILLIDELDRADEAFEAYLLEILSDWQLTIPEFGTVEAE
ncbi:MAG: MoxR family ATPase, partial [Pseudomonadota bacterium]|nr:MoxR family ATPase [Pseudomonadota bacterium]